MTTLRGRRAAPHPAAGLALPPPFDWTLYVARHSDLAGFDEQAATNHYLQHGRAEGRVGGTVDGRGAFMRLLPTNGLLLEIGPLCTPALSVDTHRVRFLDVFPTEELRRIVADLPWGKPDKVPDIDYVWQGGPYTDLIDERFDAIFTSHNVEHQPCLVTHLRDLGSVLRPESRAFLIIPDRRYCFDHFLGESSIADVLDAFIERRQRHRAASVLEHRLLLTHNEAEAHWRGEHGPDPSRRPPDPDLLARIEDNLRKLPDSTAYIDTHAWHFVPDSFAHLIDLLSAAGLIPFEMERLYPTLRSTNEFFVVLRRLPDR